MVCHVPLSIINRELFHQCIFLFWWVSVFTRRWWVKTMKVLAEHVALADGWPGAAHQVGAHCSCSANGSCLEEKHGLTSHPSDHPAALKNMAVKELGLCCFKYQLDHTVLTYFIIFVQLDQDQRPLQSNSEKKLVPGGTWDDSSGKGSISSQFRPCTEIPKGCEGFRSGGVG